MISRLKGETDMSTRIQLYMMSGLLALLISLFPVPTKPVLVIDSELFWDVYESRYGIEQYPDEKLAVQRLSDDYQIVP